VAKALVSSVEALKQGDGLSLSVKFLDPDNPLVKESFPDLVAAYNASPEWVRARLLLVTTDHGWTGFVLNNHAVRAVYDQYLGDTLVPS
jgi:hypothetical protein